MSATGTQTATPTGLSSNTLYYPYWVHRDAAGNDSAVKGLTSFTTLTTGTSDTSFDNLIAAMSVAPTDFRKGLIARLIGELYAGSCWSTNDLLYVCAAHDEQAGRLNWMNPGTYTMTAVNSPTFTTDRGFAGNASTSYLDTNFAPNTNAVQFTQNNGIVGVYQRTGGSNGNAPWSINNASGSVSAAGGTGTSTRGRVNSGSDLNGSAGGTQPLLGQARRNDSSNVSILRDGVEVTAPTARASGAIGAGNMRMGVFASATFVPHQVAAAHLGAYLDDTKALAFYTALNAYMVAVGADT